MSAALGLYRLQQVDRQLDRARARSAEIQRILEDNLELQSAMDRNRTAREANDLASRDLGEAERQVKGQQLKIEQVEGSLYGGSVHNPKELQDLQNDIASLKRHLATLEDRQLDAMGGAELAASSLAESESALSDLRGRLGSTHNALEDERGALARDIERLDRERQAVVSALARQALDAYENLRVERRGVAVAEVNDNSCSACGTTLTSALQQNARSTTAIAHCPSCGRILYAD